MTKHRCKICELFGDQFCQGDSHTNLTNQQQQHILTGLYLQQLKDMMLAAYLLQGYYQPAGPLIQHPPTLPTVKGPPPEPTPTPPQNSEGSDDLVATSTTSGGTSSTGGGFYRTYCPQYYATPPQYQDLCYPPSYSHSHPHPPPYYHKYAPPYRRQYYGYQESGAGGGPGGSGAGPGVVEYQPPPGEYLPPYYGGYPPPPPPPPPPPNPAYLHSQGRPFVDHAFQGCPCPMQSCPKNADTGPLIGNGKGAPVAQGPGLSLPPSALVGPPSPARGLAGLAPPHGANAWDTDRVQLNPAHRSHPHNQQHQQQQQQQQSGGSSSASTSQQNSQQAGHSSRTNTDCIAKGEKDCTEDKLRTSSKCACGHSKLSTTNTVSTTSCSSGCDVVKLEQSISPASDTAASTTNPTDSTTTDKLNHHNHHNNHNHQNHHHHHHNHHHHRLKYENNNVKCESCSTDIEQRRIDDNNDNIDDDQQSEQQHVTCATGCRVKCEAGYKCEIMKCEQCVKEAGQLAIMEMDKDSGILEDDAGSGKLETDTEVKEELNSLTDVTQWKKPDYEPTASEPVIEDDEQMVEDEIDEDDSISDKANTKTIISDNQQQQQQPKCQKVGSRKLSLDSLSDLAKLKKINKRTMSVGSPRDFGQQQQQQQQQQQVNPPLVNGQSEKHENLRNGVSDSVDGNTVIKESPNPTKKKPTKKESQSQKRKSEGPNASESAPKKSKNSGNKIMASESSIMETINNVIQQSLQMTQKSTKTPKKPKNAGKVEKNNKKNSVNFLTTIKRASKKFDLKAVVTEKFGQIRNEFKNNQQKVNNKIKTKVPNSKTKNNKVKAKLLEVRSKVLETKNNNKLPEIKNNKIIETKNNKIQETKVNKIPETKNNKFPEIKNNKIPEVKNNKIPEIKNKISETKNNKILETKNNKINDVKNNKITEVKSDNKNQEAKNNKNVDAKHNKIVEAKNSKNKIQEPKETKESKDVKDAKSIITPPPLVIHPKASKIKKSKSLEATPKVITKKKGKGTKKSASRRESLCKVEEPSRELVSKCLVVPRRPFLKPKWSNGWSWEGEPFEAKVYLTNEESAIRRCYVSMRHESGDVLRPLDCVLLKSGPRKADLPFVAKIAALWENPDDGEMMFSLLWYYRPEHTEQGRTEYDTDDEVFASRHRDANSVACIEDKCYILTFNEYCRYRKNIRRIEEGLDSPGLIVPPGDQLYTRESRQPPIPVPQDMVLFCRRVYDYRGKKLVKNPG